VPYSPYLRVSFLNLKQAALVRLLFAAVLLACAISTTVVFASGGYQVSFGPIHFGSHSAFKAVLQLEGAFLLAMTCLGLMGSSTLCVPSKDRALLRPAVLLGALACAVYAPSLALRFRHDDWEHPRVTTHLQSWHDFAALFTRPELDRFYRPLTYLSLWVDYRIFGDHGWGYHLQNIAIHAANSVLLLVLARRLGFSETVARWAAVLFAVAAVDFEAVMWPGARFDLLALTFTLLALIFALRYLEAGRGRNVALVALFLALGILNKESAYCFPLLLGCFVVFWPAMKPGPVPWKRALHVAAATLPVMAGLLAVRFAVLNGLGGYANLADGSSQHSAITARSVLFLFTRPPLTLLGVNTVARIPVYLIAAIALFGFAMAAAALLGARASRASLVILLCAALSAAPTLNLIGWVGESMLEARYLYMPCVWLSLFAASALGATRRTTPLLAVLALANVVGLEHNLGVYRTALDGAQSITQRVRRDYAAAGGSGPILISDLPIRSGGVLFIGPELAGQIQDALPGVTILRDDRPTDGCPALWYRWDAPSRALVRQPCNSN
jgi:hypothetical protein